MTLPAGSRWPALLQTVAMIARPISFLEACAERFGDRFTLRVLGPMSPPVVFLGDPEAIGAVFGPLAGDLELGKVTHVFRPLVGSQSLIMQEGTRHQRQRQLMMPAFHRESLQRQGQLIVDLVRQQMASWRVGQALSVRQEMAEISLRVILQVVFGLVPGDRYDRLSQLLSRLLEDITDPLYSVQFFVPSLQVDLGQWSPWGKFQRRMAEIDALIYAEIRDRRSQDLAQRSDILSMLMLAQDEQGQSLGDEELRDQLVTLLLLGHETTASALAWAFYWVHRHPAVLARLRSEIQGFAADPIGLAEQPYLTAVCKESLRIRPIALISQPRRVKHTLTWEHYTFEPGTVLIPCVLTAHGRAQTYPDPQQFRPERFLERKFSPTEWLPFGGGSRSCIGMPLSMLEMKLVLATMLQGAQFESNLMTDVNPVRRGITFVPPERFRLTISAFFA